MLVALVRVFCPRPARPHVSIKRTPVEQSYSSLPKKIRVSIIHLSTAYCRELQFDRVLPVDSPHSKAVSSPSVHLIAADDIIIPKFRMNRCKDANARHFVCSPITSLLFLSGPKRLPQDAHHDGHEFTIAGALHQSTRSL